MYRWRTTQQILSNGDEIWDDNWMDANFIQMPPSTPWSGSRSIRIEDVDIWEVITQTSDRGSVYAAWQPHAELYIVTRGTTIVAEFSGWNANARLEKYLQENGIPYPKGPDAPVQEFVPSKLILA